MKEEHEPGRCYACGEDKPVRWKNIYTIGSEGTWLCMPCEMKIVHMLRDLARKVMLTRRDRARAKRGDKPKRIYHLGI